MIATDPVAMGYMLGATGPATLPSGEQITADNAAELSMSEVYERFPKAEDNPERDAFLQQVARAVTTSCSLEVPTRHASLMPCSGRAPKAGC